MKIRREDFLSVLESVSPGLDPRDLIEQSSCFVFRDGRVYTYDDQTTCNAETGLGKEFEGAVPSKPLLEILRKLPDDELDAEQTDSSFVLKGRGGRKADIHLEAEILLPVDKLERPGKWRPLHEDFNEAVGLVQECAVADGELNHTFVHLHPKYVEACNGVQLCRYVVPTGIKEAVLARKESIRYITQLGMTDFVEGVSWIHFKNSTGLILSSRRYLEEYPDYSQFLQVQDAQPLDLPKGLSDVMDRASIFLDDAEESAKQVRVELSPGKFRVIGTGTNGGYRETKKVQYSGPKMIFLTGPKMLSELSKRHNHCEASQTRLRVDGGKWKYVVALAEVESEKPEEVTVSEE